MTKISVATEDELSEAIALKLVGEHPRLVVGSLFRRNGSGYLRARLPNFCQLARYETMLVVTDLDQVICPTELIQDWFGHRERPPGLLFRIAVKECEAWLLADHDAMREFLGKRQLRLPAEPESVADPKQFLLNMAKKGPRRVREALVPKEGSTATKGLGYNRMLIDEFLPKWSPQFAAERSPSLLRARIRLAELAISP